MSVIRTRSTSELTKLVPPSIASLIDFHGPASDSGGSEHSDELEHVAILSTN